MKTCYLDANLLLFYSNPTSPFYNQAVSTITNLITNKWQLLISTLVLDEYLHNMIRFSTLSRKEAFIDLEVSFKAISELPNIKLAGVVGDLKRQYQIIEFMKEYQLRARDAYHLFIMMENKISCLATFDKDFDVVFKTKLIQKYEQ